MPDLLDQLISRVTHTPRLRKNPQDEAQIQSSWIQHCLENHKTCNRVDPNQQKGFSFLPTRLIDVRRSPSACLANGLFILTGDHRYAALSYCWGNSMSDSGRTTLSSLAAHQRRIDTKKLPLTLREAIEVTRSLGINYLWVDALCIIQDDEDDKQREINSMAQVYSCATVTIAAGVSSNCQGGFLMAQRPEPDSRLLGKTRPAPAGGVLPFASPRSWEDNFFQNPLFQRGWTLQERELSTRVLHFTKTDVIFECRQDIKKYRIPSASFPGKPGQNSYLPPLPHVDRRTGWQYRIFDLENSQKRRRQTHFLDRPLFQNWHVIWWRTVEEYSSRQLADERDRLPAISGLADAMQKRFGWSYSAGLWAENLALDLMWRPDCNCIGVNDTLDAHLAPSWSWASAGRPVLYHIDDIQSFGYPEEELSEVNVQPLGLNEKGKLVGGFLKIRGRMIKIEATAGWIPHPDGDPRFKMCTINENKDLRIHWDRESEMRADVEVVVFSFLKCQERYDRIGAGLALRRTGSDGEFSRVGVAIYTSEALFKDVEPVEVVII